MDLKVPKRELNIVLEIKQLIYFFNQIYNTRFMAVQRYKY